MSDNHYILNAKGEPQPEHDILAWAAWYENTDRAVAKTMVGKAQVSTVFLAVDHSYGLAGGPLLYETMIFGNKNFHDYQERYATKVEALAGHEVAVAKVTETLAEISKRDELLREFIAIGEVVLKALPYLRAQSGPTSFEIIIHDTINKTRNLLNN